MKTIYDFTVKDQKGNEVSLAAYAGKVLLIVNTATGCGFTPHYEPLEAMYAEMKDQGFEILDFPCNQFANQAPGSEDEIHEFCQLNYGTEFPQFKKIEVNGDNEHPLFALLKQFADAENDLKAGFQSGFDAFVDGQVGLAEILAALGVADDDVFDSACDQHVCADFTRKRAGFFPVAVLGADFDVGALRRFERGVEIDIGDAGDHFAAGVFYERRDFPEKRGGLLRVFVHFPVACDYRFAKILVHA